MNKIILHQINSNLFSFKLNFKFLQFSKIAQRILNSHRDKENFRNEEILFNNNENFLKSTSTNFENKRNLNPYSSYVFNNENQAKIKKIGYQELNENSKDTNTKDNNCMNSERNIKVDINNINLKKSQSAHNNKIYINNENNKTDKNIKLNINDINKNEEEKKIKTLEIYYAILNPDIFANFSNLEKKELLMRYDYKN